MSVIRTEPVGWLVDHQAYINQSYRCCHHSPPDTRCHRYVFRAEYFHVEKPHIVDTRTPGQGSAANDKGVKGRKRKRKGRELNQGEVEALEYHEKVSLAIRNGTKKLVEYLEVEETGGRGQVTALVPADSMLVELCSMAKQLLEEPQRQVQVITNESVPDLELLGRLTENSTGCAQLVKLMGHWYLLPPRSTFLLSDISCMEPLLGYKKYDVITLDPPWENKSLKRSKGYSHLFPWQISQLPVPLLATPGCLVVCWVTNRQKYLHYVKEELYPGWSVEVVAEWHWVKVTQQGEFVVPLDSVHKKPYEILVLGRYTGSPAQRDGEAGTASVTVPDHKLIVSVPCTLHSHKPPLGEVLKGLTRPHAECLELFARNLQPGWTSWGNEVLRFQHLSYYQELDPEKGGKSCSCSHTP
ncbi:N(6)-adenine-specific methyltransferase METTL4 [Pristis pectinata]|uniref:N(6)-adenine-specific methyltransferase METTL4 n=1 Tax=Pristis pectinata TaxID=685728 RepID=UPI00223DC01A|nr:N(6)-adenine-specific methyltransferase METTL4 [Pristis pectinata]XP_051877356.1 N(6)-adenine-specific methyltransferase METTL4 [Pristis pectinata]